MRRSTIVRNVRRLTRRLDAGLPVQEHEVQRLYRAACLPTERSGRGPWGRRADKLAAWRPVPRAEREAFKTAATLRARVCPFALTS